MKTTMLLVITVLAVAITLAGCGKKPEPLGTKAVPKPEPAPAFKPGEISNALYVEFYAHYRIANARLLKEAQTKAGKQTRIEIQREHMAKLNKEIQALEKKFGVTKKALEQYISEKKSKQPDYWVKMIHPKLQERTSELEEASGKTP